MKRRRFFKTLAALPAAPALLSQAQSPVTQTPGSPPPASGRGGGGGRAAGANTPAFDETSPELVADAEPRFFTPAQYAALRKLSGLFMPALDSNPGALECGAPEFLDFLIGASMPDRQKLYRGGLDTLNAKAEKSFHKTFADLSNADADAIIRPLLTPVAWVQDLPKDPAVRFIAEAHRDIRTATQNSREWAAAGAASGRRRGGGGGSYLYPIDPIYRS